VEVIHAIKKEGRGPGKVTLLYEENEFNTPVVSFYFVCIDEAIEYEVYRPPDQEKDLEMYDYILVRAKSIDKAQIRYNYILSHPVFKLICTVQNEEETIYVYMTER